AFDVLVIDAFSSDAIPMHLLTREALRVYLKALGPRGLLLLHISNRYIDLAPVVAANAHAERLAVLSRLDIPADTDRYTPSRWIAVAQDAAVLNELAHAKAGMPWTVPQEGSAQPWTDDHASILPYIRWDRFAGGR